MSSTEDTLTLAQLIAQHSQTVSGYAVKQGYEHLEPEELKPFQEIIEETQDESTTN